MLPSAVECDELADTQPIVILGMHRSGTSCLAGCLEELGLHLGTVITSAPHNKKGNRENPELWPIHNLILSRVGAAWDLPPTGVVPWTPEDAAAIRRFLDGYRNIPQPWGLKDPRITLLLDGWFSILPRLRLVASVRHPVAVARSLAARNGFSKELSYSLWERYNREVLRWHSLTSCPVINFDDPNYEQTVQRVAAQFGFGVDRSLTFRSMELNHHRIDEKPPESVAGLWHELLEVTE